MPRKKKEVLETCAKIELQFPSHVTQTEVAITKLEDEELLNPKTVSHFATKLRECRERAGLTETAVGTLLNLSHVSIVGYENALNPRASIDRIYLKLFALVYDVSPLYLVGKTDNPLDYTGDMPAEKFFSTITDPVEFVCSRENGTQLPPGLIYVNALIKTLYKDGILTSREDRELMQVFLRISDAKDKRRETIKRTLFGIPAIQKLVEKTGDEDLTKEYANIKQSGYRSIDEMNDWHIFETFISLKSLGDKDLDLLKCLFAIAKGPPKEKNLVLQLLRDGGFIDKSSSFVQNDRSTKLQSLAALAYVRIKEE